VILDGQLYEKPEPYLSQAEGMEAALAWLDNSSPRGQLGEQRRYLRRVSADGQSVANQLRKLAGARHPLAHLSKLLGCCLGGALRLRLWTERREAIV